MPPVDTAQTGDDLTGDSRTGDAWTGDDLNRTTTCERGLDHALPGDHGGAGPDDDRLGGDRLGGNRLREDRLGSLLGAGSTP